MARFVRNAIVRAAGLSAGLLALYAGYAAYAWSRYGRENDRSCESLLDQFMPHYDVSMQHEAPIATSATHAFEAIQRTNLTKSSVVRALFGLRAVLLGGKPLQDPEPPALLGQFRQLGWSVLAQTPGREIVFGSVTRPWEANVTFRPLPANEFVAFDDPGFVKIAFTLRVDPIDMHSSTFYTQTRVCATDEKSRARFRTYWSWFSPGMELVRWALVRQLQEYVRKGA